jgi:glutamyl-tRNA(Gln) amidotransferase subunit E
MSDSFNPSQNWEKTKAEVGYTELATASPETYTNLGFMCGLEIHQQLATAKKLFCRCPVGIFQEPDDFDAVVIRHMRPTLSEMGEYDGTALMERRTRKNIVYRLKAQTACTYEIDDTPPFPINQKALDIAIEIALQLKSNVVGELHITRKQYLDGSIPTGFQRTAIVGVGGEISLRNKKVRIIQLSIEEDSCREVSDIGHWRIYRTDRLGMPLIEMVTYPDMKTPEEAREAGNYLRYLTRSSGKVRTGMGAARQDVNVSITGGTRIEIKGVGHTRWIPKLTHNEAYRQKALLIIKDRLEKSGLTADAWKLESRLFIPADVPFDTASLFGSPTDDDLIAVVTLPGFHGLLSHFTQPGQSFADEISGRLKVIACLEQPNMIHTEMVDPLITPDSLRKLAQAGEAETVIMLRGSKADLNEGIATIEERCLMAFTGVPNETRKSFANGTTIFERVLPGADRMYPDTDSAPISIEDERIEHIRAGLAIEIAPLRDQLDSWQVALDAQEYIMLKGLTEPIRQIVEKTSFTPRQIAHWFGHTIKHLENSYPNVVISPDEHIKLIEFLASQKLQFDLAKRIAPLMYREPGKSFESYLQRLSFKKLSESDIHSAAESQNHQFAQYPRSDREHAYWRWRMGRLARFALGNVAMSKLAVSVQEEVTNG